MAGQRKFDFKVFRYPFYNSTLSRKIKDPRRHTGDTKRVMPESGCLRADKRRVKSQSPLVCPIICLIEQPNMSVELFKTLLLTLRLAVAHAEQRDNRRNIRHRHCLGVMFFNHSAGNQQAEYIGMISHKTVVITFRIKSDISLYIFPM